MFNFMTFPADYQMETEFFKENNIMSAISIDTKTHTSGFLEEQGQLSFSSKDIYYNILRKLYCIEDSFLLEEFLQENSKHAKLFMESAKVAQKMYPEVKLHLSLTWEQKFLICFEFDGLPEEKVTKLNVFTENWWLDNEGNLGEKIILNVL